MSIPTVGAPRNPDSRPGQIRALKRGQTLTIAGRAESLEEVTPVKRKLTATWQRAISLVRGQADCAMREFSTSTSQAIDRGGVAIELTVKRVR